MKFFVILVFLLMTGIPQPSPTPVGRWQVKFTLIDSPEKTLVFTAQEGGNGSFQLLDTGPDDKPVANPHAAAWSLAKGSLSVSSEVELPIGTCCRETGTLILKAKFAGSDSISGRVIFVTNVDEEEGAYKYHATTGTFTASRLK
jgi:hypothetical protein